jgi:hypothetical protein
MLSIVRERRGLKQFGAPVVLATQRAFNERAKPSHSTPPPPPVREHAVYNKKNAAISVEI